MEQLGKLFGSIARVKIMRLFLQNPEIGFTSLDIRERTRLTVGASRREMALLQSAGFLKKKSFMKTETVVRNKKSLTRTKRVHGYIYDTSFPYQQALRNLLTDTEFISTDAVVKRFRPYGKIKLVLLSGVFRQDSDSRVDMLIVGDNIRRPQLERVIRVLESEVGKELTYAIFETPEFLYRANMYDKLVRDIIDLPHIKALDINILQQVPKPIE